MPSSSDDRHRSHRSGRDRSRSRESSRHRSSRDDRSSSHKSSSSSSHKDHKHRRRSPEKDKGRTSQSNVPNKSTLKMIEETKSRMRAALAAADSGPAVSSSVPEVKAGPRASVMDIASRHHEIERIDADKGFVPESFLSSVGGKQPLRDGENAATMEKQDQHENAIFGKVSGNKGDMTNEGTEGGSVSAYAKRPACPLAHENLSIDPKIREEKWLKSWREMRAKMLIS